MLELQHRSFDSIDHLDNIGIWLLEHKPENGALITEPASEAVIDDIIADLCHVAEPDWRAGAIGHDDIAEVLGLFDLVVSSDRIGAIAKIDRAFRKISRSALNRQSDVF